MPLVRDTIEEKIWVLNWLMYHPYMMSVLKSLAKDRLEEFYTRYEQAQAIGTPEMKQRLREEAKKLVKSGYLDVLEHDKPTRRDIVLMTSNQPS